MMEDHGKTEATPVRVVSEWSHARPNDEPQERISLVGHDAVDVLRALLRTPPKRDDER